MLKLRHIVGILFILLGAHPAIGDDVRLILQYSDYLKNEKPNEVKQCEELRKPCQNNQLAKARRQHWEIQASTCKDNYKKNKCDQLYKNDPKLTNKIQQCSPYSQCVEQKKFNDAELLKACFWNAPKTFGEDFLKSILAAGNSLAYETAAVISKCANTKDFVTRLLCQFPLYVPTMVELSYMQRIPSATKIYETGRAWVQQQGTKLECYNAQSQAEMICYGILNVFAPDKIFKVAKFIPEVVTLAKLDRTAKARIATITERASGKVSPVDRIRERASVREAQLIKQKPPASARSAGLGVKKVAPKAVSALTSIEVDSAVSSGMTARDVFSEKHVNKTFMSEAQNQRWVDLANEINPPEGTHFFDVENSAMKRLNDTTLDKNFVTALTNQHKEIVFSKIESLQKKYPDVEFVPYSDFKSMRFAFRPKPPSKTLPQGFETDVAKAFEEANKGFIQTLKEQNLIPGKEDPNWWFRAGWGETADQATFASRYSRNAPSTNHMRRFTDADLRESQATTLKYAEAYRMSVESSLKNTSLLEGSSVDGKMIPKAEVFDAIRKTNSPEQLASFLKKSTGESLTLSQAKILRAYGEMTDEFSPGIHIARREQAVLDKPTGGITFDLVGAGSENGKATADALVRARDVESAVKETRIGERSVTENLDRRKAEVRDTVSPILEKYKIKSRIVASGDDIAVIPEKPIPAYVKKEIAEALAKTDKPASIRMSSVGDGISNVTDRMVMATQGESIEKATRKYLQGEVPKEVLDKTLVSVQMEGKSVGQGPVRLVLGEGTSLTPAQKAAFEAAFAKAVKDLKSGYVPTH